MRDASVSPDDIAVQAAKNKLATLPDHPGYAAAVARVHETSRVPQLIMGVLALLFTVLTIACWMLLDSGALRIVLLVVLGALAVFTLLGAIGSAPQPTPRAFGAAVIGKPVPEEDAMSKVLLLDEQGIGHELTAEPALVDALRVGDVGVAYVHDKLLVKLVRL
jgi:hypothetical protein